MLKSGFLLGFLTISFAIQAQQVDSIDVAKNLDEVETIEMVSKLNPNKAALYSAVLPGLGQAYNGDYWKIPIVYGGGIILLHFINENHELFNTFNNALANISDASDLTVNPFPRYNEASLQRRRDFYRRNRDFMIIVGAAYYLLNVVEAHVSAHLKEFNVNENLSMQIKPSMEPVIPGTVSVGMGIAITLK